MPTPLQVTASAQFKQFTDFAFDEISKGNSKAIARQGDAATMPGVMKITTTTDDKVFAIKRSQDNKNANDATRAMFMKAIADMFGGESHIPDSVLDAMNMKDFNTGKPLTARRIVAVKRAVDMETTKLRHADIWLKSILPHTGKTLKADEYTQARSIIAKYGKALWKTDQNIRRHIIEKLIDLVTDPELGPRADDLFDLIPWNLEKLHTFTLADLREQAHVKAESPTQPEGTSSGSDPKIAANGKHFDATLGDAFQKSLVPQLDSCLARADQPDLYPDIGKSFCDALKDYARVGFGLKLGGSAVARIGENHFADAEITTMKEQIGRFFKTDAVNGERASRIIGDIVHQGFFADVIRSMDSCKIFPDLMLAPALTVAEGFSVDRAEDGSYQIGVSGAMRYSIAFDDKGDMQALDAARSIVRVDIKLNLSFDSKTGKPNIVLSQPPTISGTIAKTECPFSEVNSVKGTLVSTIELGIPSRPLEFSGELAKPDFRKAVLEAKMKGDDAALADLARTRIITEDDIELLCDLGLPGGLVEEMIAGTTGDESTPRLDKATINRLRDPATRDAAINDIKAIAQRIVDTDYIEHFPDIHAEALNLVTVAGISPVSASHKQSDVKLVMDFIDKSDDQNVRNILADLQSDDPGTVAAAKTRAQNIVHEQRQGLGLALLASHIRGIADTQIELLQKHIPVTQYTEALQHIIDRDSFMDGAIDYFKAMLETAMALEKDS